MSTLLVESLGTAEAASEALGLEVESVPVIQAVDLNAPTNIDGSSSAQTSNGGSGDTAVIVVSTVGAAIVLAVVVLLLYCLCFRKQHSGRMPKIARSMPTPMVSSVEILTAGAVVHSTPVNPAIAAVSSTSVSSAHTSPFGGPAHVPSPLALPDYRAMGASRQAEIGQTKGDSSTFYPDSKPAADETRI